MSDEPDEQRSFGYGNFTVDKDEPEWPDYRIRTIGEWGLIVSTNFNGFHQYARIALHELKGDGRSFEELARAELDPGPGPFPYADRFPDWPEYEEEEQPRERYFRTTVNGRKATVHIFGEHDDLDAAIKHTLNGMVAREGDDALP